MQQPTLSGKKSVLVLIMILIGAALAIQAGAAKLSKNEYAVANRSFEQGPIDWSDGQNWEPWYPNGSGNAVSVVQESAKSYFGENSVQLIRKNGNAVLYQQIPVAKFTHSPRAGDEVEAGAWVLLDDAAAADDGEVVVQVKYVIGDVKKVITSSHYIQNKKPYKWYYLLTKTDELDNGGRIPAGAEKIEIVIDSWLDGTVYVDFAQSGVKHSITGNPSKFALAEYHPWYTIPDYLPCNFSDPLYNVHDWHNWTWGVERDEGYNHDPIFFKQTGIQESKKFALNNASFELSADDCEDCAWSEHTPPGGVNQRSKEKAYHGEYSVKFTNSEAGVDECAIWRWIPCYEWNSPKDDNVPNEQELIQASAWVHFGDTVFDDGAYWIQVRAYYHDPVDEQDKWTLIAKSLEHISPEYVKTHKNPEGWIKLASRPVNKAIIPWQTHGLEIAIKFFYQGTIYVDKVEIGEAKYSPTQRDIASADYPLIGVYDSTDDGLIDYHLDLAHAMLFDALLVNYYGHQFDQERYQMVAFDRIAQKAPEKDLKVCAFYEPKVHLKKWGNANYDTFDDQLQAIQDDIHYILETWGNTKGYLHYRGKPVIAIFGLYSALNEDGMEDKHWCAIRENLRTQGHDFILLGDTVPDGDDLAGWFNCFSGMMNWFLIDDTVRDRKYPTRDIVRERSRDVVNGRSENWAAGRPDRFAIGLTYPKFDNEGVGAWGPQKDGKYSIDRTPTWNGDFYRMTNNGVYDHILDIDWLVVATFNDWNEGTAIEPSVENEYLYANITQEFLQKYKGEEKADGNLMQKLTECCMRIDMNLSAFADEFGRTDCEEAFACEGDFFGDCDVDGFDFAWFTKHFAEPKYCDQLKGMAD